MTKKITCCICLKNIDKKKDYFKAELYINGKLKKVDYSHRDCWLNRNNFNNQLGDLVTGVSNFAIKNGIVPEKEILV